MMMPTMSEFLTFTAILGSSAHRLAEQFRQQQSQLQKAEQVYLNTLAISAVKFYLDCMGIKTSWETSHSWSLPVRTLSPVADLDIPGLGKLECCPVLPETSVAFVPPEAWLDRIGYIFVRLEPSLKEATLIGFMNALTTEEVPVSELRSLDELLTHLNDLRLSNLHQATRSNPRVHLSQWLQNKFEAGWQSLSTVLDAPLQPFALRRQA
jgi:hypothetical protein